MSEQVPIQLIVAAFQKEDGAEEVWKELKAAKWGGIIKIDRMAIVRRTEKDKIKIKEQGDPGGGKGAVVGAVVGGILGSIAGPLGAVVVGGATGAAVGGLTAKFYDSGIPDDRLKEIGAALKPGTSAIVAIIEHKWVAELEEELQEAGADVMTHALAADIAQQLAEGKDVTFTAMEGEEGIAISRMAGNETEMEVERTVITEEGATYEAMVVNEEGAAIITAVTDGENVVAEAMVITPDAEADAAESDDDDDKGDDDEGGKDQSAPEVGAGVIT